MQRKNLSWATMAALCALTLGACGKQAETQVDRVAMEAKAKAEAEAKALEAVAKEAEARAIAIESYVYAYPLVTMEMTRRVMTNVAAPEGSHAPMGHFVRLRSYPDASYRDVTAPNADTLYTTTWIDVSKEPWILSIPDMKDRYALFPMLDGWTNVFQVPGKRTTGTKAQTYAITGPGWSGELPAGVTEYKSPTGLVWILGRIYCTGTPADYKEVHALQDKVSVVPLSAYGKPYTPAPGTVDPAIDMKTAVREQVNALDGAAYFKLFAELLKTNPAAAEDTAVLAKLAKIGVVPGQDFDLTKLDPAVAKGLAGAPKPAQELIMDWMKAGIVAGDFKLEHGWLFSTKVGVYGTSYVQRALVTAIGLGANRPQDAVYPTSQGPDIAAKYSGEKKYVMRFEKGQLPPVNGFWSLTMYDADYFFVDNPLNRYNLSQRNKLKANPDGSVDLYIQNESPGKGKESNWLPAPKGEFILMMRLYWPKEQAPSLLDGSWQVPPVKEAN
ncbi:MAG: DUF1254 domain-containing protein [Candidatus Accumulibacter phosphatis]|nr:DUF1254 domain-containing protein [Accumulibacter sp.]MCC2867368.1 DUF1254 domain-containing protein [Candidatus Accumulibacter phosphatis]MCM8580480.1 DUF1254 domain-containing protein [Accumulibacter sp.]MCM8621930.1 DUF1254 domain-containing protein [Accumulibacter sp.]MCQ1551080.1 DUF1254 domain-containing protein [Candidatus Accumulibacter phosphatis]HMW56785.1 DUF1254 domain-containing protein [Accumulibacter sp.]